MTKRGALFPFTAVLGQEKIKNALLWSLINPRIGGVIISGEKGTAKSTIVRAVEALAGGMRIVELPLNITEDRLVGAIDLQTALQQGRRIPENSLLREADGNILYMDEVNLLSDHIVNALLDAAGSGVNVVEREGISFRHRSRFVPVGSMNPEEGRLRPQFLDRFGLYVKVRAEKDVLRRAEIIKRCLAFEKDARGFIRQYAAETEALRQRILRAKTFLPALGVTEKALAAAASLAALAGCAGHRGELVLIETARAIAAFEGRAAIHPEDITLAAEYALPHRARNILPPQDTRPGDTEDSAAVEIPPEIELDSAALPECQEGPPPPGESGQAAEKKAVLLRGRGAMPAPSEDEEIQTAGEIFAIPQWQDPRINRRVNRGAGKRNPARSGSLRGRYVGYRMPPGQGAAKDIAFDATLRAAVPFQNTRDRAGRAIAIENGDLRVKIRERRIRGCILFVVDASSSMSADMHMKEVKAAILSLLNVSYQKRDRVGLIAFRDERAELLLGITSSVELAQKKLEQMPTGGYTPIAKGLELAYEVVMGLKTREPDTIPTIVLVSDGRANGFYTIPNPFDTALRAAERIHNQRINTIVLDTENTIIRLNKCAKLNEKLQGILVTMEDLKAGGIVAAVQMRRNN